MKRIAEPRWLAQAAVTTVMLLGLLGVLVCGAERTVEAQTAYETPPVLSAKYLLPPEMLAGPLFQVDDRVPTDGYLAHFTLRSELGTFIVPSRNLLRVRIAELSAIQQLDQTSKTEVFLTAAGNAAARPVEAAVTIVTNPVETLQGIPTGVSRFFNRVALGTKSIVRAASDPTQTDQQRAEATVQRVGDVAISSLGFEQVRRQMAKGLGVDPYTTNPVLAEKLTNTAWVAFSGRLGVNILVSVFVPASMAISAVSFTNDLVWDTPRADLIVLNQQKMLRMGASEELAGAVLKNRWYSLSVLTTLVTELERLAGVKGRPDILALATTAVNEEEARFLAASVQMLARLNVEGVPLRQVAARGTVVGIAPGGAIVVPAPVDYLSWTEQIAGIAKRPDLRASKRGLWLSGRMSAAAQRGLGEIGWAFHEAPEPR